MEKFRQLMDKKRKEGGKMGDVEAAARGSVLGDMIDALDQEGSDKVKNIKKVTVAAPDKKGLDQGLDKAKEILNQGESEVTGEDSKSLKEQLADSPEYDDREGEEAVMDDHANHISAAEQAGHEDVGEDASGAPESESPDQQDSEDHQFASLHDEIMNLKKELAALKSPKSFY